MLAGLTLIKHCSSRIQVCKKNVPIFMIKTSLVTTTYGLHKPKSDDFSDDDAPIEMENPYQPLASRCCLCGVHVDYKNVQLLSQFVSSFTGLKFPRKSLRKYANAFCYRIDNYIPCFHVPFWLSHILVMLRMSKLGQNYNK